MHGAEREAVRMKATYPQARPGQWTVVGIA